MSLFINLVNTYDKCSNIAGIVPLSNDGEADERTVLLPLFHTTGKSEICITLNSQGNLIGIERDKAERTIIIPCTEKSASRSGLTIAAHPLCDQLGYVDRDLDDAKYKNYLATLSAWKGDNKKLNAIYSYVSSNSVAQDIHSAGLFKKSELNANEQPDSARIAKIGVRFSVRGEDVCENVEDDKEIRSQWIDYVVSGFERSEGFDYITGTPIVKKATNHPKNLNSNTANAKLVSCNDSSGFTYRGKFTEQDEAILIDYITSQKAHSCLRWLINKSGYFIGSEVIVVWAVDENATSPLSPFASSYEAALMVANGKTNADTEDEHPSDLLTKADIAVDANYAQRLRNALLGVSSAEHTKKHAKKIVVAIFDAATPGRMGVTFYRELEKDEYLERIVEWHERASWHLTGFKEEDGKIVPIPFIGCPSYADILKTVYGKPKGANDKGYAVLKKTVYRSLMECMFGNHGISDNLVKLALSRVSNPMSFTDKDGTFSVNAWKQAVNITCALYKSTLKEDISMNLEANTSRDYLYGRLLAVAEQIEESFYISKKRERDRTTNAIRMQSAFSVKPSTTWQTLYHTLLNPYISHLDSEHKFGWYKRTIDEIYSLFKEEDIPDNSPLGPLYLAGYSLQNKWFYDQRKQAKEAEEAKIILEKQNKENE